ncbi:hypothetical protein KEM54_003804 [Ascosphaera aggregata]|nr:hypothetical protein KEM54_003804 [Ascosphaera aggregata]
MREANFAIPHANKAAVSITTTIYDRRALDSTSTLPLVNSLNNLAYLTTSSARIRDILCVDGGIEQLISILKQGRKKDVLEMWKWNLAFQCVVNIGVRGSEHVRTRVVEADVVPVIATVLENYLKVVQKVAEGDREISSSEVGKQIPTECLSGDDGHHHQQHQQQQQQQSERLAQRQRDRDRSEEVRNNIARVQQQRARSSSPLRAAGITVTSVTPVLPPQIPQPPSVAAALVPAGYQTQHQQPSQLQLQMQPRSQLQQQHLSPEQSQVPHPQGHGYGDQSPMHSAPSTSPRNNELQPRAQQSQQQHHHLHLHRNIHTDVNGTASATASGNANNVGSTPSTASAPISGVNAILAHQVML